MANAVQDGGHPLLRWNGWVALPFVVPFLVMAVSLTVVYGVGLAEPSLEVQRTLEEARTAADEARKENAGDPAWTEHAARTTRVVSERVQRVRVVVAVILAILAAVAAMFLAACVVRAGPVALREARARPLLGLFVLLSAYTAVLFLRAPGDVVFDDLGYQLLETTNASIEWAPGDPQQGVADRPFDGMSREGLVAWGRWFYFLLWTAVVWISLGLGSTLFSPPSGPSGLQALHAAIRRQRWLLYAASGLLLTELVAATTIKSWALEPLLRELSALGAAGAEPSRALAELLRAEAFGTGVVHSLELLALYVPGLLLTRARAHALVADSENPRAALKEALSEGGFGTTMRVRATQVATTLAPVLAGLLSPVLTGG